MLVVRDRRRAALDGIEAALAAEEAQQNGEEVAPPPPGDDDDPAPKPDAAKKPPKARKKKARAGRKRSAKTTEKSAPPGLFTRVRERMRGKLWLVLLAAGLFELWLFGRRGHIEVCVGRQGVHDFALLGQPRTEENTQRYPSCEKRLNIGVRSHFDELVEDGMLHACRRATILRGKDATLACAIKFEGWEHRVAVEHCPPWHDHYYQRLFWFLR
jgi:hypothetical protein